MASRKDLKELSALVYKMFPTLLTPSTPGKSEFMGDENTYYCELRISVSDWDESELSLSRRSSLFGTIFFLLYTFGRGLVVNERVLK